ncbi:hypothetical protein [Pseudarthrobacter raffinosi]|nr:MULTISPECIES: hypothetical protein [unclassified Pseudarthrobacter]
MKWAKILDLARQFSQKSGASSLMLTRLAPSIGVESPLQSALLRA